jgi:hypothetical protein
MVHFFGFEAGSVCLESTQIDSYLNLSEDRESKSYHLPTSLGGAKHDCLIVCGVLGGDIARLLKRVPEEVAMSALPRALCAALRRRTHIVLVSSAMSLGLVAPFLLS